MMPPVNELVLLITGVLNFSFQGIETRNKRVEKTKNTYIYMYAEEYIYETPQCSKGSSLNPTPKLKQGNENSRLCFG
jgi:hypothetical protein